MLDGIVAAEYDHGVRLFKPVPRQLGGNLHAACQFEWEELPKTRQLRQAALRDVAPVVSANEQAANQGLHPGVRGMRTDNVQNPARTDDPDQVASLSVRAEVVKDVVVPEFGPDHIQQTFLGDRLKPGEMAGRFGEVRCDFASMHRR